jgi:hypothetical protein
LPKVASSASSYSRREVLVTLAALGASGCGYSLAGRGSFLPAYIQTIGIPLFVNRTPFVTVEQLLTEKVRVEFQSRGRYNVAPTDAGVVLGIGAVPAGFTDAQLATRYRFTVNVSVKFDDVKQQKTLWENPALSFSDEYDLQSRLNLGGGFDVTAFLEQERAAMERLSADFARSVVSSILEAF